MPSRNRDTLKDFFDEGAMPSADMFADLIDSMLNMDDEGFRKSEENGFEITNIGDSESLISFFKKSCPDEPIWQIRFDGSDNKLVIGKVFTKKQLLSKKENQVARYLLNFSAKDGQARIGVGLEQPQDTLQVSGNIRSEGRRGIVDQNYAPPLANGGWHTIAGPFVGCQTLEVVARVKSDRKKRYALMHAIAMHTIGPVKKNIFSFLGFKNSIRYTHSFYDSFRDKLKLRWRPGVKKGEYLLQIRSNCEYGGDTRIDYHITNLWSDSDSVFDSEKIQEPRSGMGK